MGFTRDHGMQNAPKWNELGREKKISPKAPSQDLQRPWQADHAAGALPSDGAGFSYPESPNMDIVEKSMHFPTFTTQSQQRAAHAESRHEHPQDRSHEEGRQGRN